jgi:phosphohistidine swiveling domain-containing protein
MGSLDTVASRMQTDFDGLDRAAFLERYGHLRPGTYDILSPRYDEDPDRYFDWSNRPSASGGSPHPPFVLSIDQFKQTTRLLSEHRLDHDVLGLFDFVKSAIEGREYSKFVFTRNLSDALALFGELGASHGFSVDDCSYADIHGVQRLYSSSEPAETILRRGIDEGRQRYALTRQLNLPPIVSSPEDVWAFHYPPSEPNFITLGSAAGHVVFAGDDQSKMRGGILMIPSADPGYDWIFSHGIAGFITKYGGANSHMAVRAAELGIPAVVGAGETLYAKSARGARLELDCLNKHVRVLR